MKRHIELKRLNVRTRNQLRAILEVGGDDALAKIGKIKGSLGKLQISSIEAVLASPGRLLAASLPNPFPRNPPFRDMLRPAPKSDLVQILDAVEKGLSKYRGRITSQFSSLFEIDECIASEDVVKIEELFANHLNLYGWSHALLRRLVVARERSDRDSEYFSDLLNAAGLSRNNIVVTSLIHAYAEEQNFITIKRSTLNLPRRGANNRYTHAITRIPFEPILHDASEFTLILGELLHCSLIDSVIFSRINNHLFDINRFPLLASVLDDFNTSETFKKIIAAFDISNVESEYTFNKQSSAWLEYSEIRGYRALVDCYYDGTDPKGKNIHPAIAVEIAQRVGDVTMERLVKADRFTSHACAELALLEASGTVCRSAAFNYWLSTTEGEIGFEKDSLMKLMGMTRDLARTIPIEPTRNCIRIANDDLVKLILLLLLAKRSKNELDGFKLRRLLESLAVKYHFGSLIKLVEWYQDCHPVIAEYIYDVTTEDFIAKLKLASHLADIPEIRANLHEWMAKVSQNEHYIERARAVRVDHQLNRVRNEIDDHRIYVDPSRFWSWINDEVMFDLSNALTSTGLGKKTAAVSCDEALLTAVMQQCYHAFCSNAVFGIASYIGRRIRHGTFHGHLYTSLITYIESLGKYAGLLRQPAVASRWDAWKQKYDAAIQEIICERLYMHSKSKPQGLFQPDQYSQHKLDILNAGVQDIITIYTDTNSIESLDKIIIDYCWRLAETDLKGVQNYLRSLHAPIKQEQCLDDLISAAAMLDKKLAVEFKRDLIHAVDKKLGAMYSWFKRPSNIAPKASLGLLFDAVVSEIRDSVPQFDPRTQDSPIGDLELIGGAYHVLYDSFFVVLSNAAKYGDPDRPIDREFKLITEGGEKVKRVVIEICSKIRQDENPEYVRRQIENRKLANFDDANLYERRSGIPKLMQLQQTRKEFSVDFLDVVGDKVQVKMSYAFAY